MAKKTLLWWILHYGLLTAILVIYYGAIHPPTALTSLSLMVPELFILLAVGDQLVHMLIGE